MCRGSYRFLGFASHPSRHFTNVSDVPGEMSIFAGSSTQNANLWQIHFSKCQEQGSLDYGISTAVASTYIFCVSPDFTRIRRTCNTCLRDVAFQDQMFFQIELQESASPSQLRRIFSRSPISFSVNTKNVLVKFRPMPLLLGRRRRSPFKPCAGKTEHKNRQAGPCSNKPLFFSIIKSK